MPLVGDGPTHRLANPPRGVGAETKASAVVELVDGAHEPRVALLEEIAEVQPLMAVAARNRNDEPQVRLHELRLRRFGLPTRRREHLEGALRPGLHGALAAHLARHAIDELAGEAHRSAPPSPLSAQKPEDLREDLRIGRVTRVVEVAQDVAKAKLAVLQLSRRLRHHPRGRGAREQRLDHGRLGRLDGHGERDLVLRRQQRNRRDLAEVPIDRRGLGREGHSVFAGGDLNCGFAQNNFAMTSPKNNLGAQTSRRTNLVHARYLECKHARSIGHSRGCIFLSNEAKRCAQAARCALRPWARRVAARRESIMIVCCGFTPRFVGNTLESTT